MLVSVKHMRRHLHAMSCWLIIDFSSIRIVVISFPIRNLRNAIAARRSTKQSTRLDTTWGPPRVLSVSFNLRLRMPLTGSRNAVVAVVPCTPEFETHSGCVMETDEPAHLCSGHPRAADQQGVLPERGVRERRLDGELHEHTHTHC